MTERRRAGVTRESFEHEPQIYRRLNHVTDGLPAPISSEGVVGEKLTPQGGVLRAHKWAVAFKPSRQFFRSLSATTTVSVVTDFL